MCKNWSSPINLTVVSGAPRSQSVHYVEAAAFKEKERGVYALLLLWLFPVGVE